jgi:serine/threonine protein kinase
MTPEQRERISELFEAALEREPSERDAFLNEVCDDDKVRAEVRALLSQHERAGSFMQEPLLRGFSLSSAHVSPPSTSNVGLDKINQRYQLLGEAGRGGMGIVYRALDRETHELVALKVLRPEIAADELMMERFRNELRLARRITHKNVCRIYDFNRTDLTAYISMEFVEGNTIRDILNRFGTVSRRKGLQIAKQVCAGLHEAHSQGIVHRDLKPENLMLDQAGQVKVMDFGIARSLDMEKTTGAVVFGTLAYMAPEQLEGNVVDQRSDIYSLGLTLYEMFTGSVAFSGDTRMAVEVKQTHEQPTPPREMVSAIPEDIEGLILKCLQKDPAKRFQSVEELEMELAKLGDSSAQIPRRSGGTPSPAHRDHPRSRLVLWTMLACGFLTGLAAALGVAWIWMNRYRPITAWHDASVMSVAFSGDGRFLVTASEDKTIKIWEAKTRRLVRTFSGHTRLVEAAIFSPDGQLVTSASLDKTIRIWEVATGKELRKLAGHATGVEALAFSSNGSRLASGDDDGKVKLWDFVTGRELLTFAAHHGAVDGLSFSPDGRTLATASSDESVRIWEVPTGRLQSTIRAHSDGVTAVTFSPDGRWVASASYDKTIKLSEVATRQELRSLNLAPFQISSHPNTHLTCMQSAVELGFSKR